MIKTFINRPVFTTIFILVFVVFGLWSYPKLGVDLYPDVDLPLVAVTVTYEGTAPEEMETDVYKRQIFISGIILFWISLSSSPEEMPAAFA